MPFSRAPAGTSQKQNNTSSPAFVQKLWKYPQTKPKTNLAYQQFTAIRGGMRMFWTLQVVFRSSTMSSPCCAFETVQFVFCDMIIDVWNLISTGCSQQSGIWAVRQRCVPSEVLIRSAFTTTVHCSNLECR